MGFFSPACKEEAPAPEKFKPKVRRQDRLLSYPFEKTLTDARGREIRAIVVGRTRDEIIFQKDGSTKRHRYSIQQLSEDDRSLVARLPVEEWRPDSETVKRLRAQVKRIEFKVEELEDEIAKTPKAETRNRSLAREIEELMDERDQVMAEIARQQKKDWGEE